LFSNVATEWPVKIRVPVELRKIALVAICVIVTSPLVTIFSSNALARSWSYHYRPAPSQASPTATPTPGNAGEAMPAPGEELSTARLLKRAIVSDLAVFVEEQHTRSDKAYADHSDYVVRHLSLFDPLHSPDALAVFASLSAYYLGNRGEDVYHCLSLRRGKSLEPYLESYLRSGNTECTQELGPEFSQPSTALLGYPLCPTNTQQKAHIALLINEINAGDNCSDGELATLTGNTQSSAASR
jgi:hypothetical protein